MSLWNSPKVMHIYMVSIPYFVLRFCERFFMTRSITHATGTNIYIYILESICMMVWRCGGTYLWIYWRTKEIDIGDLLKHYLSHITERSRVCESTTPRSPWPLISQTLFFWIKCHFNVHIWFLQYYYLIVRSMCF
jgi:hypothetical protein